MKIRFAVSNDLIRELLRMPIGRLTPLLYCCSDRLKCIGEDHEEFRAAADELTWFRWSDGKDESEPEQQAMILYEAVGPNRVAVSVCDKNRKAILDLGVMRRSLWVEDKICKSE